MILSREPFFYITSLVLYEAFITKGLTAISILNKWLAMVFVSDN
jgi:hypothetical protein